MSEREQKALKKKQVKPTSTPTPELKPGNGQTEADRLTNNLIATDGATAIPTHARQLGDTQVQTAQRQAMAASIGQVGNNRYLQQVISQMQQGKMQPTTPEQSQEQTPAQPIGPAQAEQKQAPHTQQAGDLASQAAAKPGTGSDVAAETAEHPKVQAVITRYSEQYQAILNDATLAAAEKVQQVNDIVEQTIIEINAIMEEERNNATTAEEKLQAEITCGLIKSRLDKAVAEASASMLEDEIVAARVNEIKNAIRDGTGNILIDDSSLDGETSPYFAETFRQRMTGFLDTLMLRPAGLEIIMQIMDDTETVTITADESSLASASRTNGALELDDGTPGPGCNTTIRLHPGLDDDDVVLFDDKGNDISAPVWLILGHELIHAAHNSAGRNVKADESGMTRPPVTSPDYGNLEEERTITTGDLTENDMREQFGLDGPRHGHGGRVDDDPGSP